MDYIFNALPDDWPTISDEDCTFLIRELTKEEIFITLNSLSSNKSPGPDGFNSVFYKFFWDEIGDHLYLAIKKNFKTTRMPKAWGRTYVALIPKIGHPKKVVDFRPISLCNIYYKIITKILANHLKVL